jgi:protein arginine kinase
MRGKMEMIMNNKSYFSNILSPWMYEIGPENEIILSSRVRLARNLDKYQFPSRCNEATSKEILEDIKSNLFFEGNEDIYGFDLIYINELENIQKLVLMEKHLISPNLLKEENHGACIITANEQISIMVNEEDHIRIQCLFPGLQLKQALELANKVDDYFEEKFDYAYSEDKGYLTSCPTNVGTGLRASVMMHLPALKMTNQINNIVTAMNQLGLVVRGIYGEGSEAIGNIFQVSNQTTLGKSENEIIDDLHGVILQIVEQEKLARKAIIATNKNRLEDRIFRSFGILKYSRIISSNEAAEHISNLRLGIDTGIIDSIPSTVLFELLNLSLPGFLQMNSGRVLMPEERDYFRAILIREKLNQFQ